VAGVTTRILLITVDSLRADAVGAYGGSVATPAIDRLAEEGTLYRNAFATGPHTTQSFPGILGSNYPTTGGSVQTFGMRVSVAECFRRAGYRTAAFHSNPLLSRSAGYGRGFETFYDSLPERQAGGLGAFSLPARLAETVARQAARRWQGLFRMGRGAYRALGRRLRRLQQRHEPAESINRRALAWLRDAGDRFFLWLHYMDPHWPYGVKLRGLSAGSRKRALAMAEKALRTPLALTPDEARELRCFYEMEVRHLDGCLGQLFDALRDMGLWRDCAVVLTADHGEAFLEHGVTFHGDLLYDELIRVPLIIHLPGTPPAVHEGIASLIDLAPTLCEVGGVQPSETFEGRPLFEKPARRAVFAETAYRSFVSESPRRAAVRTIGWKLIRNCEDGSEELYDLLSDPGETRRVGTARPAAAAHLRRLLEQHLRRPRRRAAGQPPPVPNEDEEVVKARLRALGYTDEVGD